MHLYLWDWKKEISCSSHVNNQSWILNQLIFFTILFWLFFQWGRSFSIDIKMDKKWRYKPFIFTKKSQFAALWNMVMKKKSWKNWWIQNSRLVVNMWWRRENRVIVKFADFMIVPKILKYTFQFWNFVIQTSILFTIPIN